MYVMVAHNHPSGDPAPSEEDDKIAEKLKEAGALIGIDLIDFIIVGDSCYSYRQALKL